MWPQVTLTCDGLDPFPVTVAAGVIGQSLDLGFPVVREVSAEAPDADGTLDTTSRHGARTVTLALHLADDADVWALEQRLRAFLLASRRPVMLVQQTPAAPLQRVVLRPVTAAGSLGGMPVVTDRPIVCQWVCPSGVVESAEEHSVFAPASGAGTEGGRTYDLDFDRTYAGGSVIGETTVFNAGTVAAYPLLRLYGPIGDGSDDVHVLHVESGRRLAFTGLTVGAGEFVEIDTRAKTVRYLGDGNDSRYDDVDFGVHEWWSLAPGPNTIRVLPDTSSPPAGAEIVWRDAWL